MDILSLLKQYLTLRIESLSVVKEIAKNNVTINIFSDLYGAELYRDVTRLFLLITGNIGHTKHLNIEFNRSAVIQQILNTVAQKELYFTQEELKESIGIGVVQIGSCNIDGTIILGVYTQTTSNKPDVVIRITGEVQIDGKAVSAVSLCHNGQANKYIKQTLLPELKSLIIKIK